MIGDCHDKAVGTRHGTLGLPQVRQRPSVDGGGIEGTVADKRGQSFAESTLTISTSRSG
jgi:hypothetical protein